LAVASAFVARNEGTVPYAYRDPIGVLTACVGETHYVQTPGDLKVGARFTQAQCTEALYRSMAEHAEPVMRCTAPAQLTDGQKVAFLDFSFNVGGVAFCRSGVAAQARAGNVRASCDALLQWRMAGGRDCSQQKNKSVCGGVWTRRLDEQKICLSGALVGATSP
jgi:lysozyme